MDKEFEAWWKEEKPVGYVNFGQFDLKFYCRKAFTAGQAPCIELLKELWSRKQYHMQASYDIRDKSMSYEIVLKDNEELFKRIDEFIKGK